MLPFNRFRFGTFLGVFTYALILGAYVSSSVGIASARSPWMMLSSPNTAQHGNSTFSLLIASLSVSQPTSLLSNCVSERSHWNLCLHWDRTLRSVDIFGSLGITGPFELNIAQVIPSHHDLDIFSLWGIEKSFGSGQSTNPLPVFTAYHRSQSRLKQSVSTESNESFKPSQVCVIASLPISTSKSTSSVSLPSIFKLYDFFLSSFHLPSYFLRTSLYQSIMSVAYSRRTNNTNVVVGYTRAQREAMAPEVTIKVKEQAVKKVLAQQLTANVQVSSFDPTDIMDKSSFFRYAGTWRTAALFLETHCKNFCMHGVFELARVTTTQATDAAGDPMTDADGNPVYDLEAGDSLFDVWHSCSVSSSVSTVAWSVWAMIGPESAKQAA